jgi:hypothetical protein
MTRKKGSITFVFRNQLGLSGKKTHTVVSTRNTVKLSPGDQCDERGVQALIDSGYDVTIKAAPKS